VAPGPDNLGDPLGLQPSGPADRVRARAFGASLDAMLAAGVPPESSRLLATRARDIVSLPRRQALARDWEHLLRVARNGKPGQAARRLRASRIAAAGPAISELAERLGTPLPVGARGVAMANVLLTDAAGPVYNRHSRETLETALEAVIEQLDPARPVFT
jgi:hypothetical protein